MDNVGFPACRSSNGKGWPLLRQAANPSPNCPTVRYVFIEGEGTFFPRLRSRQQTQNPLPWEQPGGSGPGGRRLCLLCQRVWPMCLSPSGKRSTHRPRTADTLDNELWPGAEYIHRMTSSCLLPLNTFGPHGKTGNLNSPFHSLSPFPFPE